MTKTHINIIVIVFSVIVLFTGCKQKDTEYYTRKGMTALRDKDYRQAINYFTDAIKMDGRYLASAYGLRAEAYVQINEVDSAIADLGESIKLNNRVALTYAMRGFLFISMNETNNAENDFKKAIALDSLKLSSYAGMSWVYLARNQLDSALTNINFVIQKDSLYSDALVSKGMIFGIRGGIYKLLNQKDKAIADFKTAVDMGFLEASEVLKNEFNIDYPAKP
jgi:tetratricopeptide (TPR) repeat protein